MKTIIYLDVRPSSKEEKIDKIGENNFKILVKESPEKGKANKTVVKILAKYFGISYRNIRIKNFRSRKKIIEIERENN